MDEHAKPTNGAAGGTEPEPEPTSTSEPSEERSSDMSGDAFKAMRALVEQLLDEAIGRVRGESGKLGGRATQTMSGALSELGLAQRRDQEDIELRIAQLEHRIRLLEQQADEGKGGAEIGSNGPPSADS